MTSALLAVFVAQLAVTIVRDSATWDEGNHIYAAYHSLTRGDFGLNPEETAIWFGILVLIVVEVGLITPPVGLNLFIINSMAPGLPIAHTYRGVLPFVASDLVRTAILVMFPAITLWLIRVGF